MKKNKIFEFLTLLTLSVGMVIGVGEFIKNDSETPGNILNVSQNAVLATILWVVIGISCVFMILAFIEIASSTSKKGNGTISSWMKLFANRKVGSFVSLYYILFYLPAIYCYLSIMAVQFTLTTLAPGKFQTLSSSSVCVYLFLTLIILSFFAIGNTIFTKPGKYIQIIGTILKAIPFILVLILGIIAVFSHNSSENAYKHLTIKPSLARIFLTTGPILFSFDGFIMAANLQKETKNKDLVYKALIIGMIIIASVYALEAIALFTGSKDGSVLTLFENFFGKKIAIIFQFMIIFTICIGINGFTVTGSRYIITDTNNNLIYNFNKNISRKSSGLLQYGVALIWLLILFPLGCFAGINGKFDPTQYMGLLSNVVVEFSFSLYMTLIILVIINRFTKKVKVRKVRFMPIFSGLAFIILTTLIIAALYFTLFHQGPIIRYIILGVVFSWVTSFLINEYLMTWYSQNKIKYLKKSKKTLNINSK